jgi:hypothetical protein
MGMFLIVVPIEDDENDQITVWPFSNQEAFEKAKAHIEKMDIIHVAGEFDLADDAEDFIEAFSAGFLEGGDV